jgi:hypothetical protein
MLSSEPPTQFFDIQEAIDTLSDYRSHFKVYNCTH